MDILLILSFVNTDETELRVKYTFFSKTTWNLNKCEIVALIMY